MKGTILINETVFLVEDIQLFDGHVQFYAHLYGPAKGFDGGITDIQIFDRDGHRVSEGRTDCPGWESVAEGESALLIQPVFLLPASH